jgi:hypothetical protein
MSCGMTKLMIEAPPGSNMFAAHCLFERTLLNNPDGVSRNRNMSFFQDGGKIKKIKEHPSPWSSADI